MADNDLKMLCEVQSEIEAEIIKSLLDSFNIDVMFQDIATGAYVRVLMGISNMGMRIMVHKDNYEKAMQIYTAEFEK